MTIDIPTYLCCPNCRGELTFKSKKQVVCKNCQATFTRNGETYQFVNMHDVGFNTRWAEHPKPQANTINQLLDKTGWKQEDFQGKTILDAGCGCGRFLQLCQEWGGETIGIDSSEQAIASTKSNCQPGTLLLRADLLHVPLKNSMVDMAFSIGVLHHTPDPKKAFLEVARTVKPGGELAIWVYCCPVSDPKYLPLSEFFHAVTSACSPDKLHAACAKYAVAIRDVLKPNWGPLEQIIRPTYSEDNEECISDNFDWHTPQYRSWHTYEEVREWFAEAGFVVTREGKFPVSVTGKKAY